MSELPPACALVAPLLPELALGVLPGDERAKVLAHVEGCRRCSAEAAELSATADELLCAAPGVEPPAGFELRLLERLRSGRPRRYRRVLSALAAAAVVFAVGALAGHALSSPAKPARPGPDLEAVPLLAGARSVGQVMVYAGNPTWVFVDVDNSSWSGALRCQVLEQKGPVLTLGEFWLSGGKGAWAASVQVPAGRLVSARVVDSQGRVLAVAPLS